MWVIHCDRRNIPVNLCVKHLKKKVVFVLGEYKYNAMQLHCAIVDEYSLISELLILQQNDVLHKHMFLHLYIAPLFLYSC